jgi:hypothetical protein
VPLRLEVQAVTAWKKWEDTCAVVMGGRRVLGNRGGNVSDSDERTPFSLECKHGYGRIQLRADWLEQARANAKREGRPWAIVQRPKHARRAVVTLDWLTFVEICQKAGLIGIPTVEGSDGAAKTTEPLDN